MFTDVNERISVIRASDNPLSADVYLIKGDKYNWIFDVGECEESRKEIEKLPDKCIVISHFHRDHMGNLLKMDTSDSSIKEIYLTKADRKYLDAGVLVEECLEFDDGVKIKIMPIPSTHEKGCLALELDEKILFVGDATYPHNGKDRNNYVNVQKLKTLMDFLEKCSADSIVLSHDKKFSRTKAIVLRQLQCLYAKREKGKNIIEL